MSILSQQPRWLLLSVFLLLWSWSSFRRDSSRGKALGLGVEAHLFGGGVHWEHRRQSELAPCTQQCANQAGQSIGCGSSLNLICVCHSPQFMPAAVDCMTQNCSPDEKAAGQDSLMASCKLVGTSASLPGPPPTTDTSITSGVPPISGPSTTADTSSDPTVTPPATSLPSTGAPTSSPSPSDSSSTTSTSTAEAPPTTTVTSTSTTIPVPTTTAASTRPLTTVVETSTLNIAGPAPSAGGLAGGVAGNGASAVRAHGLLLAAVLAGTVMLL